MTKQEMAAYMVDLLAIMESKESAGRGKGITLAQEYTRVYDEFVAKLKGENNASQGI